MSDKRLLVVDDEPEFGELVRKVATGLGYEARATTTGHAFQTAYHELHPTHIVMDMVMPEMDGNELVLIQNPAERLDHAKREIVAARTFEIPAEAIANWEL